MPEKKIVIIDGNSLVNRAFYAIQRPMITSDGFYTNGIYGFLSMLFKIRKDHEPTHMLVAFDRKAPTFRHQAYTEYKAGRKKMPEELAMEMPVLKDVLHAMGIMTYELDGFEADDIMGTTVSMAQEAGIPALVITGDKDALQLAGSGCTVIINKKGVSDFVAYDEEVMKEEYGFSQSSFIDFKALFGDPSDNIPGVAGIGKVTAQKLIQQFGSIEALYEGLDKVSGKSVKAKLEEGRMDAFFSKKLATIVRNVPVEFGIDDCIISPQDKDRLIELYSRLEFRTYLNKLMKEDGPARENAVKPSESADSSHENGEADAPSAAPAGDYPSAEHVTDKAEALRLMKECFDCGDIVIDIVSDLSHVRTPSLDAVEVLCDKGCYTFACEDLAEIVSEALKGRNIRMTGFNLGRIYYVLLARGIDCSGVTAEFDCALAQYVLHPGTKAPQLEDLIFERFHEELVKVPAGGQLAMFSEQDGTRPDPGKKLYLMRALSEIQEKEIEKEDLTFVFRQIELPLAKVMASMEAKGFRTDGAFLRGFGSTLKEGVKALEQEIYGLAGESFNINSPKQLGVILFEKLGLPAGKKTKSGYSTSADILEKLAPDYLIVEKILEYRTLSKLDSTYVEGMLPLIAEDGRIHAHFQQTVTATGRISCTEPNLQNIPVRQELGRKLRTAFTADSGDHILIGADYSQIELRVMAHMSGDETLIDAFNKGLDIHRETASKVFGVPQELVTSEMRSNAKAVNFGVIYGMSGFGLASELTITRKEAEQYIKDYFDRFPQVKAFLDRSVEECRRTGRARTLYGRKREVPEIGASQFMVRQLGERLAMNTPIQGTAADIIKLAMIKVYDRLAEECPGSDLILQVHDELIINARKDQADKVRKLLVSAMEEAADLKVKLEVSLEEGDNWYQLK